MRDRFNREINYLRIAITDRCNFRCLYCIPPQGVSLLPRTEIFTYEEILQVVNAAIKLGINRFRITGGEPLFRKGIIEFLSRLTRISGVESVSLTTNGYLLERYHQELIKLGLSSINVSLNSLNPERFKAITGVDGLAMVWQGIKRLIAVGSQKVKVNTVLLKGLNETELVDFAKLTLDYPLILRYIEYMPCGQWDKQADLIIQGDEARKQITSSLGGLIPYQGKSLGEGPARYYQLKNGKGVLGFIEPVTHSFCEHCNRIRLTSEGHLKSCLLSEKVIDIKPILRSEHGEKEKSRLLTDALRQAILDKPIRHNACRDNVMSRIGG